MPHQQKRIYSSHHDWLSLIYHAADCDAILKAIKIIEESHIHMHDIRVAIAEGVTFEVVE